jgi:hypothetical protein
MLARESFAQPPHVDAIPVSPIDVTFARPTARAFGGMLVAALLLTLLGCPDAAVPAPDAPADTGTGTAAPTYTVSYDGNGSTGGTVPMDGGHYAQGTTVTVAGVGSLVKTTSFFAIWNTAANGSGTSYAGGATFPMGSANVILYARWTAVPTYTVTYDGNGSTGGTAPVDGGHYAQGDTVTVAGVGSLVKSGSSFVGWNTAADGSGTIYSVGAILPMGSADLILYARWAVLVSRQWFSVASDSTGAKLAAVVYGGQVYTSTNSGVDWTARDSTRSWFGVASDSTGTNLVAWELDGKIYTSANSGVSWTARDSNRFWYGVASDSTGAKLVAVVAAGQIYTSTDYGVGWTPRDSSRNWVSVASDSTGARLVAGVSGGQIYTSTDSGVSWTPRDSARAWIAVASDSAGTKLAAIGDGSMAPGKIYTSTNSGVDWTARDSDRLWNDIASDSTGAKLVAVVNGGQIYTSTDSGVSWTIRF